jgi:hypothetical protein
MKPSLLARLAWAAAVAALVLYVLRLGPALPAHAASHFRIGGQADAWQPRSRYLALFLGAAGVMELMLFGLGLALPYLPRATLHLPRREYWLSPEHFPEACAAIQDFLCWTGALLALWLACLHGLVAQANRLSPPHLDGAALAALVAAYAGLLVFLILRLARRFRRLPA